GGPGRRARGRRRRWTRADAGPGRPGRRAAAPAGRAGVARPGRPAGRGSWAGPWQGGGESDAGTPERTPPACRVGVPGARGGLPAAVTRGGRETRSNLGAGGGRLGRRGPFGRGEPSVCSGRGRWRTAAPGA